METMHVPKKEISGLEIQLNLCIKRAPKHPSGKREDSIIFHQIQVKEEGQIIPYFVCYGLQGTIRNMNDSCKQTSFSKCHVDGIQL